jgi:hypothetical protein
VTNVIPEGWIDMSHGNHSMYRLIIAYNSRILPDTRIDDPRI